jgi:hypothetical protein
MQARETTFQLPVEFQAASARGFLGKSVAPKRAPETGKDKDKAEIWLTLARATVMLGLHHKQIPTAPLLRLCQICGA